ncbi:DNA cytosine methyltransferase [Prevotella buccae]|uniref:DNA cytosine methyltransferase n=1 Tax=Segatella buccae TaxID=28126 RepID=UPI001C5FFEE4|nr:DNA cytosine methyltransferase [Segatella buccae]MBW4871502.1 DNA cytosine methyltransferase [Segatella buccae]
MKALSLFSCIGVSEYYLKEIGVDVVVASDIDKKRCSVHKFLYPDTTMVCGDITKDDVKEEIIKVIGTNKIDLIISTPPCQGLSTIGRNKGKALIETNDERNFLILETFKFIDVLKPSYIIFENVPQLLKIKIPYKGEVLPVQEILKREYDCDYNIKVNVYNTCHFGIPQNRERVFIRMCKKGYEWNDPMPSNRIITLKDAIGDLPSLEAGETSNLKNHWARKHPANQVEWLRHTPTGCSAFNNKEYYPVKANRERVKGYPNCYKRMTWDMPSPTVTMRNEIMSSQDKVHPGRSLGNGLWSDARVLTIRELLIIMSMPPDLDLPTNITDTALRQYIGEGIPSLMMKTLVENIANKQ